MKSVEELKRAAIVSSDRLAKVARLLGNSPQRREWLSDYLKVREELDQCVFAMADAAQEAEARIANEIAARQRAQEHGIGDRARIEKLERERDRLQVALNLVSGALVDSGNPVPVEAGFGEAVRVIVRERDEARAEIAVDDTLLAERNRLLDLFECGVHGKGCVPHAIDEVKSLRAFKIDILMKHVHPGGIRCGWCPR
jgi:hypothetical protein